MDELHPRTPSPSEPIADTSQRCTKEVYDWVEWLIGVLICVVLVLTFGFRTIGVYGESMEPTLLEGDRLITTQIGGIESGDIVAIAQPNALNKPLIKRVIATGGQTIDIDFQTGDVWVDGVLLDEPYINERTYTSFDLTFPLTVPEGYVFAMGDNRNNSWDSRASGVGMIDERYILGKALFRFLPFDRIGCP